MLMKKPNKRNKILVVNDRHAKQSSTEMLDFFTININI